MGRNKLLGEAKRNKKDEFYTQLSDIEKEVYYYTALFKGKTVLCNCDDPFESNFFKYFALNFNFLGLKKLLATSFVSSQIAGVEFRYEQYGDAEQKVFAFGDERLQNPSKRPYKAIVTTVHDTTGDGGVRMLDVAELFKNGENQLSVLQGSGDFKSEECIELLEEADIVVTNPPFSLFREYVALLEKHKKKYLIIGNKNAITYKEIFPLIKDNKLWTGVTPMTKDMHFIIPQDYLEDIKNSQRTTAVAIENGKLLGRSPAIWFTNLDHKKRHEKLRLGNSYDPALYPKYNNYDAIEVSKTSDIPKDYDGVMGVPITFLDKYCPEQFEIVGTDSPYYIDKLGIKKIGDAWINAYKASGGTGHITANMHSLCYYDKSGLAVSTYKRILIKRIS